MKSAKSYFSKSLFTDLLKRYWWFGFINLLALFFAIPINFLLTLQRYADINRYETTALALAQLQNYVAAFFSCSAEGAMFTIVVAMLSALVAGLVFFNYLHKREQVNFFHSQPVSRECLFSVRIAAGITLFFLPYLITLGIALLIAAIGGQMEMVAGLEVLAQIGFVLLVFVTSYALVVLAGALCGTAVAQAELALILVFAPLLVYVSLGMLFQRFYDTFYNNFFTQKSVYYSPVIHWITLLEGNTAASVPVILSYVLLAVAALGLALWLYLKRPSEGAGMPLVFAVTAPLVKYVGCFIAAVLLGMFFDQLGGFGFMIFGFIAGMLLCSLFAEAQFHRDFKAMFANLRGLAVFGLGFAILVAAVAYDVTGYDNYRPDAAKVKSISFNWNDSDIRPIFYKFRSQEIEGFTFASREVKNEILSLVDTTLEKGSFIQRQPRNREFDRDAAEDMVNSRDITILYELGNGRQVARQYRSVSMSPVQEQVRRIISHEEYKGKHAIMQLGNRLPVNITVEPVDALHPDYRISKSLLNREQITALLAAVKADVRTVGETVDHRTVYRVNCDGEGFQAEMYIYENYARTLALLEQIATAEDIIPMNAGGDTPEKLEIRSAANPQAAPLLISRPAEIAQVIKGSFINKGAAMTLADEYVISLPLPEPLDGTDPTAYARAEKMAMTKDGGPWTNRYFVIGQTPDFVKNAVK